MSVLTFKQVSKSYSQGDQTVDALKIVDFSINKGEFVAVIGPSGSGKSTFLSIAGALLQPSSGEVIINNKAIQNLNSNQLAEVRLDEIGFIFQSSNLIPFLNVEDQLLAVKRMKGKVTSKDIEQARDILVKLGLGEKLKSFPEQLSGGEKQRTAIARAFMNDPSILLADEPTASLDTAKAHDVVKLIAKEVKDRQKAAIMVTHDERLLPYCDKVYRIEDGILKQVEHANASAH